MSPTHCDMSSVHDNNSFPLLANKIPHATPLAAVCRGRPIKSGARLLHSDCMGHGRGFVAVLNPSSPAAAQSEIYRLLSRGADAVLAISALPLHLRRSLPALRILPGNGKRILEVVERLSEQEMCYFEPNFGAQPARLSLPGRLAADRHARS